MAPERPELPLRVGQRLAHYRIGERLGAGGMGDVYRGRDEQLDRDVAVKVLLADQAGNDRASARLLREARAAASLNHPHICIVHEVGEADGRPYIAMELVEGQLLSARLATGPVPPALVVRFGVQLAAALEHAHERGVIHRDLKCANVMITPDDRVKVLDFGLAKRAGPAPADAATRSAATLTQPGTIAGTLVYMAPEQLRGRSSDARSDLWALGVVLFEMAAGARPFRGDSAFEVSAAIFHERPAPLPAAVSPALASVIERCLEKDPARRYQQAREVRAALEAIQSGTPGAVPASRPRVEQRRLAVLPLLDLAGVPGQEYFVDGTHEALLTDLAGIGALRVIARSSVMRYKGRDAALAQVAADLKVDLVLTGSIWRQGSRVRITAQLIDVATEEHVWAGRYERTFEDVLSLQNEIVTAIAHAIELQLTPQEEARLVRRRPVNADAYEAYLQGRFHWYKVAPQHYDRALKYFELALEKDSGYALAHVGIATTWAMRGDTGLFPVPEVVPKVRAALSKALALDDGLAEVHEALANTRFLHDWDWSGAEREFQRAVALNPSYADAHFFYADFLMSMKRPEEAAAEMARALDLDPLSAFFQCFHGWHLVYRREYEAAVGRLHETLMAEPALSSARLGLWGAFYGAGRHADALREARRFFTAIGDADVADVLAPGATAADYAARMGHAASRLAARAASTYVPAVRVARLYAHASEVDHALEWLERAYEGHESTLIHLSVGWDWEGLRHDRRFQDLLQRMHLPQ